MTLHDRPPTAVIVTLCLLFAGASVLASTGPAHLLKDINQTLSRDIGSFPDAYHRLGDVTFFRASTRNTGTELWRSDGTTEGTVLAQDIAVGLFDARPRSFAVIGHRIFFLADDGFSGYEPWVARTAILLNQPAQAVQDLTSEVKAFGLARGLETSLLAQLDAAMRALSDDRASDAIAALEVFSQHVDVLTPRWIPEAAGAGLREFAAETESLLEGTP